MYFWLVQRKDQARYEEWQAHVILAKSCRDARRVAAKNAGRDTEDPNEWLDGKLSICKKLTPSSFDAGIVISDYNAG